MKILFISEYSEWSERAVRHLESIDATFSAIFWERGNPKPTLLNTWEGDWIFSFKSDLILEGSFLRKAKKGAINFHPGPPNYRGIGGHLLAIENKDCEYGVTCHHMVEKIDAGPIIMVNPVPIFSSDTPERLKRRSDSTCLKQFIHLVGLIYSQTPLPSSDKKWEGSLHTYSKYIHRIYNQS